MCVQNDALPPVLHANVLIAQWKGVVSIAAYDGSGELEDFGNGRYNDHHFHFSYHIQTAATIVMLDQELGNNNTWFETNVDWVNALLRDVNSQSLARSVERC